MITKPSRLVDDMHKKVALFLCKNFNKILIPEFKTQDIIKKLNYHCKEIKNAYLRLSHYKFRMFLINKAKQYNVQIIVCNEAYTSKTCSSCGKEKQINRWYKCDCGLSLDRDINAARNIFLKYTQL